MLAEEGLSAAEEGERDAAQARAEAVVVGFDRQLRAGSVAVEGGEEGVGDGRGFFGGGGVERRQCRRVIIIIIIIRLDTNKKSTLQTRRKIFWATPYLTPI